MDRWIIHLYSFSVFYQQEQQKKEGEKNSAWVMLLQGHVAGYSTVRPFSIFVEIPKWNTVPYFILYCLVHKFQKLFLFSETKKP